MTAEMWRVVDGRGGVREVPVRVEGGLLLVGPGPQPRYFASEEPPRLALMHYALTMRWPLAEILAPGEPTRSEKLVERQHFRDLLAVIHRDGGQHLVQHGVERACFDGARRVLYDREALGMVERERDAAISDRHVMHQLHGERSEELIAAEAELARLRPIADAARAHVAELDALIAAVAAHSGAHATPAGRHGAMGAVLLARRGVVGTMAALAGAVGR